MELLQSMQENLWYSKDTIYWQLDMLLKDIAPYCSTGKTMCTGEVDYTTISNVVLTSLSRLFHSFSHFDSCDPNDICYGQVEQQTACGLNAPQVVPKHDFTENFKNFNQVYLQLSSIFGITMIRMTEILSKRINCTSVFCILVFCFYIYL